MIAYLQGRAYLRKDFILMVVGAVGYQVFVPGKIRQLVSRAEGEELTLEIYSHIKEDRFELYGFQTAEELELFKLVISVSGVGPKTALSLINQGTSGLIEAVQEAKLAFFTAVPRVGKKSAQKIIIELRGKLGGLKELNLASLSSEEQDLLDALMALGFDENRVRDIISQIDLKSQGIELAIKEAIRLLSQQ